METLFLDTIMKSNCHVVSTQTENQGNRHGESTQQFSRCNKIKKRKKEKSVSLDTIIRFALHFSQTYIYIHISYHLPHTFLSLCLYSNFCIHYETDKWVLWRKTPLDRGQTSKHVFFCTTTQRRKTCIATYHPIIPKHPPYFSSPLLLLLQGV